MVVPPTRRDEDIRILAFDPVADTVTLSRTPDTVTAGDYGFWFSRDLGYARLGGIVAADDVSVTRRVLEVEFGDLAAAQAGRWTGWFYLDPRELGYSYRNVEVPTPLGPAPAWLVPAPVAEGESDSDRWVIQVHGRAVRRQEAIRSIPVFREAGYTSLVISYRNDGDAPQSIDGRYGLGDTEWNDVASAMKFAVDRGAREIVLMGYSMGGATALQALTRSPLAALVTGVVLDSPVIDWKSALRYQGGLHRLPDRVSSAVLGTIGSSWGRFVTGQDEPIDLDRLDFVERANELSVPVLIMHSTGDDYIPRGPSAELAAERPDIVTYDEWDVAGHTRLWNYDPERWNATVRSWLRRLPERSAIARSGNRDRLRATGQAGAAAG